MKAFLTAALLLQGLLGSWLAVVYLQGNLHSGPFVALVLLQSLLSLIHLASFLGTFAKDWMRNPALCRLLAFLGVAIGVPALWILANWWVQSMLD